MYDVFRNLMEMLLADSDSAREWETVLDMTAPWPAWVTLMATIVVTLYVITVYLQERIKDWQPLGFRLPQSVFKAVLIASRLVLFALLMFMFYEWSMILYRTESPDLVLMLDVSQSMSHVDEPKSTGNDPPIPESLGDDGSRWPSRLEHVQSILLSEDADRIRQLNATHRLKTYLVGESPRLLPAKFDQLCETVGKVSATDDVSRLGDGLRDVLETQRGRSTAAIVLFSDGNVTDGMMLEDAAVLAAAENVPLYFVGVGIEREPRDVIINEVVVDDVVFVNDIIYFDAQVMAHGYADVDAELILRQEGRPEILARKKFRIPSTGSAQRIRIPYQPTEAGRRDYVIEVKPREDESSKTNNQKLATVTARDDTIRVLLVQGYPNYEFRFLKSMLTRAEASIDLTTVLQDADYDYVSVEKTARRNVPVNREELFRYDVILLGDVDPSQLGEVIQRNIAEFVEKKGGGLVMIAGSRYLPEKYRDSPLTSLFPMRLTSDARIQVGGIQERCQVRPTQFGLMSSPFQLGDDTLESVGIWKNFPYLDWYLTASDWKPGIRILAEHPHGAEADGRSVPLITMHYFGAGKVVFHAIDSTWRWRYRVGDVFFARYWLQTIRYLSRSRLQGGTRGVELTTDRQRYRLGDTINLRVRFIDERSAPTLDDGVTVAIEQDNAGHRSIPLRRLSDRRGIFRAVVTDLPAGSHHAWVVTPPFTEQAPSTDFTVTAVPGELSRLSVQADEMRRSAEITGGLYFNIAEWTDFFENLPAGKRIRVESTDRHTLWNTWQVAFLFVLLLTVEWLLRRKVGLL